MIWIKWQKRNQLISTMAVVLLLTVSSATADEEPVKSEQAALEKAFQDNLSGATLVGHFTRGTAEKSDDMSEERYSISKVVKLPDKSDKWRFFVRIQYGDIDINVPLDLNVKWAGDTPVISLTRYSIPGLGTFSARVLIYDGQYAGTWSHGDSGGHLFGKVEKARSVKTKAQDSGSNEETDDERTDSVAPSKGGSAVRSEAPER